MNGKEKVFWTWRIEKKKLAIEPLLPFPEKVQLFYSIVKHSNIRITSSPLLPILTSCSAFPFLLSWNFYIPEQILDFNANFYPLQQQSTFFLGPIFCFSSNFLKNTKKDWKYFLLFYFFSSKCFRFCQVRRNI